MADLSSYTILVVDDEPDVRTFITTVLEDNGATVHEARNGDEALELARRVKPHLVTLDLNMPGMTGDQAFEELRALDPQAPVVFVSGYWDRDLERKLRDLGALGFVQKPYEAATLRDAIVQAMTSQAS